MAKTTKKINKIVYFVLNTVLFSSFVYVASAIPSLFGLGQGTSSTITKAPIANAGYHYADSNRDGGNDTCDGSPDTNDGTPDCGPW